MRVIFLLLLAATPLGAQDFARKRGDVPIVSGRLLGQTHVFYDGGQSFFSISGTYTYTYSDGGVAYGAFETRPAGVVCTSFRQGFHRCDQYVENDGRLLLITEKGDRFPVKAVLNE